MDVSRESPHTDVFICRDGRCEGCLPNPVWPRCDCSVLPQVLPRLSQGAAALRAFEDRDAPLVQSVALDPIIPLITTVPASGAVEDALAFIERQHERVATRAGYSFAIADATDDRAVVRSACGCETLTPVEQASVTGLRPSFDAGASPCRRSMG